MNLKFAAAAGKTTFDNGMTIEYKECFKPDAIGLPVNGYGVLVDENLLFWTTWRHQAFAYYDWLTSGSEDHIQAAAMGSYQAWKCVLKGRNAASSIHSPETDHIQFIEAAISGNIDTVKLNCAKSWLICRKALCTFLDEDATKAWEDGTLRLDGEELDEDVVLETELAFSSYITAEAVAGILNAERHRIGSNEQWDYYVKAVELMA
jgi:hypothetical protein